MGLSSIYILRYNNYYNRQLKKLNTLQEYGPYEICRFNNVNFNPGDGIYTKQLVNYDLEAFPANYFLEMDNDTSLLSRWFIVEAKRTLSGQYELSLYRDTIADYFDIIKDAPMFVEKGYLPETDPMILNDEQMTFNQIKTSEVLLKDKTKCPWLVGYYSRKFATGEAMKGTVAINKQEEEGNASEVLTTPITSWEYYKYSNLAPDGETFKSNPYAINYHIMVKDHLSSYNSTAEYIFNINGEPIQVKRIFSDSGLDNSLQMENDLKAIMSKNFKTKNAEYPIEDKVIFTYKLHTKEEVKRLLSYKDKVIKDSNGKYFHINIITDANYDKVEKVTAGVLYEVMNYVTFTNTRTTGTAKDDDYQVQYFTNQYSIELEELANFEVTYDMTSSQKLITDDAPYNIFAIPFGAVNINIPFEPGSPSSRLYTTSAEIGLATMMSIIRDNPGTIYDAQLLPYCPCQDWLDNFGHVRLTDPKMYSEIKQQDEIKGFILNVPKSKFTFNMFPTSANLKATNLKRTSQTDKYRLVSPNYNGQFEFNLAKNGSIDFFNVDCYYKPYNPYIHVNPNFGRLYGRDFDDARGLVCGGDFSLTMITDQWRQYELQNKNYQASFDRQIENMEVNNKFNRIGDVFGAAVGTVQGAATGAGIGMMVGGNVGATVGGVAGGIGSAATGIADVYINEKLRNEALDYTKDQFGFQLGNIQALPYSLTKVSAFTNNNKLFPFLEYYTCTEQEKKAFDNKIKYNGMTVGRIGTMNEFITYAPGEFYFKGKLIRANIGDDTHLANSIADELNKGIFIGGPNE